MRRSDALSAVALCAGIVIAWAYERGATHATPIDTALPFIAVVVSFVAWLVREERAFYAISCAVPLLLGCSLAIVDERMRLIGFGLIAASAFGAALFARETLTAARAAGFVIASVGLLRWIGRDRFEPGRELLIVLGCVLIALATRGRKFGVMLAVAAGLVSPAIPVRTVAIPYVVAVVCWIAFLPRSPLNPERERRPSVLIESASALVVASAVLLFPWSGAAARSLPYFWRVPPSGERIALNWALAPGQTETLDLPEGATSLIVSGANALQLHRGTILGRIDPGAIPIRIGQVADWGYARREQFWKSRNVMPQNPAGLIRDYGYDAWIEGAGRVPLPAAVKRIRITADRGLPAEARLQVEAIEVERR